MEDENYYKILGVAINAKPNEIRKSFLKKNLENHPDKLGINEDSEVWKIANDYIKKLNQAYETLSDPYLRSEYDAKYFSKAKTEDTSKKYSKSKTYEKPKQDPVIRFNFDDLGFSLKQKILARQFNNHLFKYQTKSVIRSYIWIGILALWFPILYSMADSTRWKDGTVVIAVLVSVSVAILISRAVLFLIKWQKSEIKWNVIVTPLYFIFTELNKITYCHLWGVKNVENTNNYRNGVYTGTTTKLEFEGHTQTINFNTLHDHTKFAVSVDNAINTVIQKQNSNDLKYFLENDDLYGENIPPITNTEDRSQYYAYGIASTAALFIFYLIYNYNLEVSSTRHLIPTKSIPYTSYSIPLEELKTKERFDAIELALPKNGAVKYYTRARRLAPLQVFTRSSENYYLKLEDSYSRQTVLTVFIRGGLSVNLEVPLGTYYMKYAAGEKWYGEELLFGPYTSYNKASSLFTFDLQGNQYSGYTVELFKQVGGNLNINEISPREF